MLTVKRVGGRETKLAHADQVKAFHVSGSTPREGRRRTEPQRPSAQMQARFNATADVDGDSDVDASPDYTECESDAQVFEVEQVVGHFRSPNGFWFLIKWVGFLEPTWEHESMLNAPKLVTQYFKSVCESDT